LIEITKGKAGGQNISSAQVKAIKRRQILTVLHKQKKKLADDAIAGGQTIKGENPSNVEVPCEELPAEKSYPSSETWSEESSNGDNPCGVMHCGGGRRGEIKELIERCRRGKRDRSR